MCLLAVGYRARVCVSVGSLCLWVTCCPRQVEALLRQQQEQLALLEELEEKRRELEQRLRDTQQTSATLQEAARRQSTTLPEPPAEVRSVTPTQSINHVLLRTQSDIEVM